MKNLFGMRKMVGVHQGRERSDVFLVILLPAFLMLFASYTNAWALTQGKLAFDHDHLVNTSEALLRGLFTEVLVFAMFMMARIIWSKGGIRSILMACVPALVGLFGVLVSAGSGLAWAAHSGDVKGMVAMVANLTVPFAAEVFQVGLGLLFPVALAVLAVYDAGHVIKEHIDRGAEMGALAVHVESSEHFQNMMLEAQKAENEKMRVFCQQIAQANAQRAVDAAKTGDLSFGLRQAMHQTAQLPAPRTSVTPIADPLATRQFTPIGPGNFPPPMNGQVGPAPAWHQGNTQQLNIAPPFPQNGGPNYPPNPSQR